MCCWTTLSTSGATVWRRWYPEPDGAEPRPAAARLGRYGEFISDVWEEIRSRVREYPREAEYRRLLWYDFRQLCNQVDYSGLLHRHPHLINQTEHDLYSPHGMMCGLCGDAGFDVQPRISERGSWVLREAVWHATRWLESATW
ncbi:MAG: hypothetical protein U0992_00625 [Planctomycetaceae bacterium]